MCSSPLIVAACLSVWVCFCVVGRLLVDTGIVRMANREQKTRASFNCTPFPSLACGSIPVGTDGQAAPGQAPSMFLALCPDFFALSVMSFLSPDPGCDVVANTMHALSSRSVRVLGGSLACRAVAFPPIMITPKTSLPRLCPLLFVLPFAT